MTIADEGLTNSEDQSSSSNTIICTKDSPNKTKICMCPDCVNPRDNTGSVIVTDEHMVGAKSVYGVYFRCPVCNIGPVCNEAFIVLNQYHNGDHCEKCKIKTVIHSKKLTDLTNRQEAARRGE